MCDSARLVQAAVRLGDFRQGGGGSGWGGTGAGTYWGGMTIQGLVPYFFEKVVCSRAVTGFERGSSFVTYWGGMTIQGLAPYFFEEVVCSRAVTGFETKEETRRGLSVSAVARTAL